jgi:hypothetical protein
MRLQLELLEQQWAERRDGKASPRQLQQYQKVASALKRILKELGLQRRSRDITPTVEAYVASLNAQEEAE